MVNARCSLIIMVMLSLLSINTIFTITRILETDPAPVIGVAFTNDGSLFAGKCDGTLHRWDTDSWNHNGINLEITSNRRKAGLGFNAQIPSGEMLEATVNKNNLIKLSLSPDNKTLAASNAYGDIMLWNIENFDTHYKLLIQGNDKPVFTLEWSPNSQYLAAGSTQETIYIFKPSCENWVPTIFTGGNTEISSISWSPDSSKLAFSRNHFNDVTGVAIWSPFNNSFEVLNLRGGSPGISHTRWSPNGQYIAATSFDHKMIVWDAYSGEKIKEHPLPNTYKIRTLVWSPDSKLIATIGIGATLIIIDPLEGTIRNFPDFHALNTAAFYNSSWYKSMIAAGCENGCIAVFDKDEVDNQLELKRFTSLFKL